MVIVVIVVHDVATFDYDAQLLLLLLNVVMEIYERNWMLFLWWWLQQHRNGNNFDLFVLHLLWIYKLQIMKLLQYCFFGLLFVVLMGTFDLIHIKATQPNASQSAYMMSMWLFYYACLPLPFFKANNNKRTKATTTSPH
jgi:hypothetical protein